MRVGYFATLLLIDAALRLLLYRATVRLRTVLVHASNNSTLNDSCRHSACARVL